VTGPTPSNDTAAVDAATDAATDPGPAVPRAGRRPALLIAFVALTAVLVAADLVIKELAFARVAGVPVVLDPAVDQAYDVFGEDGRPVGVVVPPADPGRAKNYQSRWGEVLVPKVLHLYLTTNTGAVFGLGKGGRWVFITVTLAAVGVILFVLVRSRPEQRLLHVALAMILAGALGNLYDRVRYGAVRDMFWLIPETGLYPWIFNFADAALVVGVGLVLIHSWFAERQMRREVKSD